MPSMMDYETQRKTTNFGLVYTARRREPPHFGRWLVLIVFLLILALWGAWALLGKGNSPTPARPPEPSAVELPSEQPSKTSPAVLPEVRADSVEPAPTGAMVNLMRLYNRAWQEFDSGNYEVCRRLLRPLFEALPSDSPLYRKAESLLGRASMTLYSSGGDPEAIQLYTVKRGDILSRLARKFESRVDAIQRLNGMAPKDTALRVGQRIKIPKNNWSIRIGRTSKRLFLYSSGKLFKIYHVTEGSDLADDSAGSFKLVSRVRQPVFRLNGRVYRSGAKENPYGAAWFGLGPEAGRASPVPSTAIHGTNEAAGPEAALRGYFRLKDDDMTELYALVPQGTPVRIEK